ncbi:hypothetical protein, partial [Pseudomonas syringae group genomosp. 7]|uniref:hypothetical protein n=1 Tax=Pseudomonas syringae group genomosp. 7 TaxID=251699 RepID=UPI00376FC428
FVCWGCCVGFWGGLVWCCGFVCGFFCVFVGCSCCVGSVAAVITGICRFLLGVVVRVGWVWGGGLCTKQGEMEGGDGGG